MKNFSHLQKAILHTYFILQEPVTKTVNPMLTSRYWLIGYYIAAYEQHGEDSSQYGDKLLEKLSEQLGQENFSSRNLRLYRQFYCCYPQIGSVIQAYIPVKIWQTLFVKSQQAIEIGFIRSLAVNEGQTDPLQLMDELSFSHFALLLMINDPLRRVFYEQEAMRCSWSVRELKRQLEISIPELIKR